MWEDLGAKGGHSLHGSVDWNTDDVSIILSLAVTPYMGVWIEIVDSPGLCLGQDCHSLHGSVDWNAK